VGCDGILPIQATLGKSEQDSAIAIGLRLRLHERYGRVDRRIDLDNILFGRTRLW
jgi:hypothetical protein